MPGYEPFLLCDFHVHTTWSDGRLSVREVIDLYGQTGRFDVIAITDHILMARDLFARAGRLASLGLKQFSVKVGTIFEDSPIPLEKWLPAMWLLTNSKNGISSYEIGRALEVTQKTAWFMLHRIRLAMQSGSFAKFGGPGSEVEAEEAFIGGKAKNMRGDRRAKLAQERQAALFGDTRLIGKAAVMGMLDREQRKVRATVVPKISP